MKKILTFLLGSLFSISLFAQTKVEVKKLGKTLESNKDSNAAFTCELSLGGMQVLNDGTVSLPDLAKKKVKIVSGMDMTNISERISFAKKVKFNITFNAKDLSQKIKVYAITNIDGIESVAEYNARLAEEARIAEEKRRAQEEKERRERERLENLTKLPVQVVNQETINVVGSEAAWLPGQIQDKLKSSLQEHLGMKTVVDSKIRSCC